MADQIIPKKNYSLLTYNMFPVGTVEIEEIALGSEDD